MTRPHQRTPRSRVRAGCRPGVLILLGVLFVFASSGPAGSAPPPYADAVMADLPSGYWRLNEGLGVMSAADSSGNGAHGTYGLATRGVDGGLETDGDFAIGLGWGDPEPTKTGDMFDGSRSISGATGAASANNAEASKQSGEPNHAGNTGGKSLWFSWQAPASGTVTFDTRGSGSSSATFDSLLAVYTGSSVNGLTLAVSNDDESPTIKTSRVTFSAVANTIYRVAVDGKNGASALIELQWIQGGTAALNNNFVNAELIDGQYGQRTGTTTNATTESGEPAHAANAVGRSVWYRWTAPFNGTPSFEVASWASRALNTVLAIYTGSAVNGLTLVGSNTGGVTFNATQGTTYRIAVDGANAAAADFSLSWNYPDGPSWVQLGYQSFDFVGHTPFSLEAWVQPGPEGSAPHIFGRGNYENGYSLEADAAEVRFERRNVGVADRVRIPTPLADGEWSHVVGTYDGTALALYVNGVQVASTLSNGLALPSTNFYSLNLGILDAVDFASMPSFGGFIDEAAVYPRALSPSDVADHYESGTSYETAGDEPALTDQERTRAIDIATQDPRFVDVVGSRPYAVTAAGPWLRLATESKIGATLSVSWAEPATINYAWPIIEYDSSEVSSPPYSQQAATYNATNVSQIDILVDLERGAMVAMEPGNQAEAGSGSSPPGFTATHGTASTAAAIASGDTRCTRKLRRFYIGGDWFWNYDFTTDQTVPGSTASRCKVDWPISLIFWDNATVRKAKGVGAFVEEANPTAATMHARMQDGLGSGDPRGASVDHGRFWDEDKGSALGILCTGTKRHYRVYAPFEHAGKHSDDRMFNLTWSFYVIASAHKDVREGCFASWSGESESVEQYVADVAEGQNWAVARESVNLQNAEGPYTKGNKHVRNSGKATKLKVP